MTRRLLPEQKPGHEDMCRNHIPEISLHRDFISLQCVVWEARDGLFRAEADPGDEVGGWFYIAKYIPKWMVLYCYNFKGQEGDIHRCTTKSLVEDTGLNLSNGRTSGVHSREATGAVRRPQGQAFQAAW